MLLPLPPPKLNVPLVQIKKLETMDRIAAVNPGAAFGPADIETEVTRIDQKHVPRIIGTTRARN